MPVIMNTKPSPSQLPVKSTVVWPKWKRIVALSGIGILLIAWFALGVYLHQQVVESRAKVEQARLEAQRRDARLRREAQYKQDVQRRTQTSQTRNVFDGR